MKINSLNEVINFDSNFKTAINLYLSLNKKEKVISYIPTKSSVAILNDYLCSVVENKQKETLLVGPYGKGKSHLLLVLMAILSMERVDENYAVIKKLEDKINEVEGADNSVVENIEKIWNQKRFLPVIINDTNGDLNQAFLVGLRDALNRENLIELVPNTYFSAAVSRVEEWERTYPETYKMFERELANAGSSIEKIVAELNSFSKSSLELFKEIYPKITSGSLFNPFVAVDLRDLYRSVSELLVEEHGYSGLYIIFDEFSKFIEGINGNSVGNTMSILQNMCEFSADSKNAQIHITMVAHKSIKEYGKYLTPEVINGFTGIEGRLSEKYFITSSKNNYELVKNAIIKDEEKLSRIPGIDSILGEEKAENYYQLPVFRSNFEKQDFKNIVFKGCYPLNPIASCMLLNVSEKVAQNERTLFTFISNNESLSMAQFVAEHEESKGWIIGTDLIYDYFSGIFKKDVENELVHNIWLAAEYALSKCKEDDERKLIKALAIFLIVNKDDELPANEKYLSLSVALADPSTTIDELVKKQVIYKKGSSGTYVFKTRAGSELKAELKKHRALKGTNVNYSEVLRQITGKYYIIPRKYNSQNMMTRYFKHEYMEVDAFLSIFDSGVLFDKKDSSDGKVITLYSFKKINVDEVKSHYMKLANSKLVIIVSKDEIDCAKSMKDFEILQELRNNQLFISNNEILKKELPLLEDDLARVIKGSLDKVYVASRAEILYYIKEEIATASIGQEEKVVNKCCEEIYFKTPHINNEMINRSVVGTSQTRKARVNVIDAILKHADDEQFYSGTSQEATIYRALFVGTGIKNECAENNIQEILCIINEFIDSCCDRKTTFTELITTLTKEPYGMRLGVIPFYLAYVMSKRKEDLVGYFSSMEIQIDADVVVNMCEQSDKYSLFVSKEDYLKECYIRKCNELFNIEENRALTDNRIKNVVICMQRWFRALPQIARNASSLSMYVDNREIQKCMKAVKKVLQKIEYNPYEMLFVDIPKQFSANNLSETYEKLEQCKKLYDNYYEWMEQNTVNGIYDVFGRKEDLNLYHIFKEWYERQSNLSKQGLHSSSVTNFMSCIERLDVFSDNEIAQKIVKAVTNVYLENWIDDAYDEFVFKLSELKNEIEHIQEEKTEGKLLLSFTGSNGKPIEKFYERVAEDTGIVLRNIIEDTLEEFDDLSVNDRVGILLEMIEKIIG